jgi:thioredoxin 1
VKDLIVYELKGGMMNWRSQNMPESSDVVSSKGMSMKDYTDSLQGEKLVLVDFYADWCAPCMKMKPFLDKIAVDMSQEVKVLRVDVETHKSLANELKISAIPILRLYKNNSMVWEQNGFIGEKELREAINKLK